MLTLDLDVLPQGQAYEDRYRGFLSIFETIALTPAETQVEVLNPPWSWVPLLYHLNATIRSPRLLFEHCEVVQRAMRGYMRPDRTAIEVLCGFRPETADALWKCDCQFQIPPGRVRAYPKQQEFIVTSNGAFSRPEVLEYLDCLALYQPTKRKVVLAPCAADKPYPAPIHKAILDILPEDYYLMNVTGVLGLIPQDLWHVMPFYDSGIPNEWRVYNSVKKYFTEHQHDRIIVYSDFYSLAIRAGLQAIFSARFDVEFILPVKFYPDYIDLLDQKWLEQLIWALEHDPALT